MEIQNMIDELNSQLVEANAKLEEQSKIVEELGAKYSEQFAILKVMRKNIQTINSNLMELKKGATSRKTIMLAEEKEDDTVGKRYYEVTKLLEEAITICVHNGLIVENTLTKNGNTISVHKSILNRARNVILRRCTNCSVVEWIRDLTDNDIKNLRDVGKKTGEVIRVAREIVNGRPVSR